MSDHHYSVYKYKRNHKREIWKDELQTLQEKSVCKYIRIKIRM